jgi:4-hydroxy-tetrahydrodipicolinate synthase
VSKLSNDIDNIIGIKDGSGQISQTVQYIRHTKEDFSVLCGRSQLLVASMAYGASGAVASIANFFPELLVQIYNSMLQNNYNRAFQLEDKLSPFLDLLNNGVSFPANVKELCLLVGMPVGHARKPLLPFTSTQKEQIKKIILRSNIEINYPNIH